MARRNYKREALLMCAADLESHYDSSDGFHLEDTEPDCTPREATAFRRALRDVIRSLYRQAGVVWTHEDDSSRSHRTHARFVIVYNPGPLTIVRLPEPNPPMKEIRPALTRLMACYGLRQKDISSIENADFNDDAEFCANLERAYDEADSDFIPAFNLWDWVGGEFVLVRPRQKMG